MSKPFRTTAAAMVATAALATSASAQTIKSGDLCYGRWYNQAQQNPNVRPEVNRGAILIAVSGHQASLHMMPGYEGFNAPLPPTTLNGWVHMGAITLSPTATGYAYTYTSRTMNADVAATLTRRSDGSYQLAQGRASGTNRDGTGIIACVNGTGMPVYQAAANAKTASAGN